MSEFINDLVRIVGEKHVLTTKEKTAIYTEELRGRYTSNCLGVVLPNSSEEVSEILKLCGNYSISAVPQGGNTGAMGGAVATDKQLIVNLGRMNKIINIDPTNYTMEVQSGCILANIQEVAKDNDRFFPLSLGAQGSCQIGGNLATNAGGINVLRYGNTRDLVLGIEVVLANGKILNGLNSLRKNNTGYDLKNLFIGSEGTLGIITAAVLKLFPSSKCQVVALIGLESISSALKLLGQLKTASSDRLTTFELMSGISIQTATKYIDSQTDPFSKTYPWYLLSVVDSSEDDPHLKSKIESALGSALECELIFDAVIAENLGQAQRMILLREDIVEAQKFLGGSIKHDVSVPISSVPIFMEHARRVINEYMPNAIHYPYAHLGDGNIHYNISQSDDMEKDEFLGHWKKINTLMHDITHEHNGSFSAEHGVGISKLDEMEIYKNPVELELYKKIKNLMDPDDILNPGKMLNPHDSG